MPRSRQEGWIKVQTRAAHPWGTRFWDCVAVWKLHFALKIVAVQGQQAWQQADEGSVGGNWESHHPTSKLPACRSPGPAHQVMLPTWHSTAVEPQHSPALSPGRMQSPVRAVSLGPHFPIYLFSSWLPFGFCLVRASFMICICFTETPFVKRDFIKPFRVSDPAAVSHHPFHLSSTGTAFPNVLLPPHQPTGYFYSPHVWWQRRSHCCFPAPAFSLWTPSFPAPIPPTPQSTSRTGFLLSSDLWAAFSWCHINQFSFLVIAEELQSVVL